MRYKYTSPTLNSWGERVLIINTHTVKNSQVLGQPVLGKQCRAPKDCCQRAEQSDQGLHSLLCFLDPLDAVLFQSNYDYTEDLTRVVIS